MKAHHVFVALVSLGLLAGCTSNMMGYDDDPDTSFNDQMAAFENPALVPDDQMPPAYDNSSSGQYPADDDPAYASSAGQSSSPSRHSARGGSGGGAEEVPFSETRINKTPGSNVGAL